MNDTDQRHLGAQMRETPTTDGAAEWGREGAGGGEFLCPYCHQIEAHRDASQPHFACGHVKPVPDGAAEEERAKQKIAVWLLDEAQRSRLTAVHTVIEKASEHIASLDAELSAAEARIATLEAELEEARNTIELWVADSESRRERITALEAREEYALTSVEWLRLSAWFSAKMEGQKVKPANTEFTAGACRDAATAFESAWNDKLCDDPQGS